MKIAEKAILAYPVPNKDYTLSTDASDQSIGACLSQLVYDPEEKEEVEKPISFLLHKLIDLQTKCSTIEKEANVIYYALQKVNDYLHCATSPTYIDSKPLEHLLNLPIQIKKIEAWAWSKPSNDLGCPCV